MTYTDGTTSSFTQTFGDWGQPTPPVLQANESVALAMPYRNVGTARSAYAGFTFDVFGYGFALDPTKTVKSLTLPTDVLIKILAAGLS